MEQNQTNITLDQNSNDIQTLGQLNIDAINKLLGLNLPTVDVQVHPGAIKHIKRKHLDDFNKYFHLLPDMIKNPDYVGKNPKEPNSIELYKRVSEHVLVALKLDPSGYLYLSSMYELNNGNHKIHKRLRAGRIVHYNPNV
jgi:hypothetical protein